MKRIQGLINSLAVGALALAMISTAAAQTVQGVAKVVRIKGSARLTTGNNVWVPLKVGTLVNPGSLIQTAKDSYVDLVLGDSEAPVASVTGGTRVAYQATAEQNSI